MKNRFLTVIFLVSALMMLPACDWKSWMSHSCNTCSHHGAHDHGSDNSACCISLNGKPAYSQKDFENKFNDLCQARPDIKQALQNLPAEQQQGFYDQFAEAVLAELLITRYMKEEGLTDSPEYKKAAQQAHEAVETQLMNNMFQSHIFKQIEKEITDEMAEKYYMENRDRIAIFKRAPFIDALGGVSVVVIEGLKQAEAQDLAKRAEKQDLKRVAQESNRKVKDLGLVTARSMDVDENVRSKVLGYSSAPQVDVVKLANGKYAVVKATAITKDTFKPYSDQDVKESVKSFLIRNELGKAVTKTMEDLKQKYGAVIHRDVIMKNIKNAPMAEEVEVVTTEVVAPQTTNA